MKKSFLKMAGMWMSLVALAGVVACSDPEDKTPDVKPVVPEFPNLVEADIEPGGTYTLKLNPNTDWKVSVPTATANLFWIQDGEHTRYSLEGKAGSCEVVIACANIEDFHNEALCEVSMTMGEETKIIARLTRQKKAYEISFYTALVDGENNDFVRNEEDYSVVYDTTPATAVELIWPANTIGYMQWIQVQANFEWTIGGEIPAWLSIPVTSGEAGETVSFRFDSNSAYYPAEDTTCKLLFQDQSGEESVTVAELEVTIPGSKDYLVMELASMLTFDIDGNYLNDGTANELGAHGTMTSTYGAELFVLSYFERNGITYLSGDEAQTSWVQLSVEAWDESLGLEGLRSRRVELLCTPNDTEADRKALILALPASVASGVRSAAQLVANDFLSVKEAYQSYVVCELTQQITGGESQTTINPRFFSVEEANAQDAYLEQVTSGATYEKYKEYGVPVYELTFIGERTRNMAIIQGVNYNYTISEEDKAWLSFDRSDYATVVMNVSKMPSVPTTGAIFFYPEDTTDRYLFIMACTYKAE